MALLKNLLKLALAYAVCHVHLCLGLCSSGEHSERAIDVAFDFDPAGRLITYTDSTGSKTAFTYNERGLLESAASREQMARFGYDVAGNRTWMQDAGGTTAYSYDAFNRFKRMTFRRHGIRHVDYDYDPWGRVSRVSVLDEDERLAYAASFTHDMLGRLKSVEDTHGVISYEYVAERGEVVRTLPDGTRSTFSYSPIGLLSSIQHLTRDGGLISRHDFRYDAANGQVQVIDTSRQGIEVRTLAPGRDGRLVQVEPRVEKVTHRGPDDAPGVQLLRDGDGVIVGKKTPKGTIAYFIAPFGEASLLRGECGTDGKLSKVTLMADRLFYDWRANPGPTYYLEADPFDRVVESRVDYYSERRQKENNPFMRFVDSLFIQGWAIRAGMHDAPRELERALREFDNLIVDRMVLYRTPEHRNPVMENLWWLGGGFIRSLAELAPVGCAARGMSVFVDSRKPIHSRAWGSIQVLWSLLPISTRREIFAPMFARVERIDARTCGELGRVLQGSDRELYYTFAGRTFGDYPVRIEKDLLRLVGPVGGWIWRSEIGESRALSYQLLSFPPTTHLTTVVGSSIPARAEPPPAGEIIFGAPGRGPSGAISTAGHIALSLGGGIVYEMPAQDDSGNRATAPRITSWETLVNTYSSVHSVPIPGAAPSDVANLVARAHEVLRNPSGYYTQPYDVLSHNCIQSVKHLAQDVGLNLGSPDWKISEHPWQFYTWLRIKNAEYTGPSGPNAFISKVEQQLGGVKLSAAAEFLGSLGNIHGAVYDPRTDRLVLIGEEDAALPSLKPEHLAVAFESVFCDRPFDPEFTLLPAVPTQPLGKWHRAYYIPEEQLRGTQFGKVMYAADWLLKQQVFGATIQYGDWLPKNTNADDAGPRAEIWSSGRARTFTQAPRKCPVPGFQSLGDLVLTRPDLAVRPVCARLYIEPERVVLGKRGNAFHFAAVKMRIVPKKMEIGPDGQLRDVETDEPIVTECARIVTGLYDKLAATKDGAAFGELKELAKAIGLAKWVRDILRVRADRSWAERILALKHDTPDRVTALMVTHEKRTEMPFNDGVKRGTMVQIGKAVLFGGVSLRVLPEYADDDGRAARLEQLVMAILPRVTEPTFNMKDADRTFRGTILPITAGARDVWARRGEVVQNGIRYRLGADGEIIGARDSFGNDTTYIRDTTGRLTGVDSKSDDGWRLGAARKVDGATVEMVSPTGHKFAYDYDGADRLTRVRVDERDYAECRYDDGAGVVSVKYGASGFSESAVCQKDGRITNYSRFFSGAAGKKIAESISFEYLTGGKLAKMGGTGVGTVAFFHAGERLAACEMARARWQLSHDDKGRVTELSGPQQICLRFAYSSGHVKTMAVGLLGQVMETAYEGGRITSTTGWDGRVTRYLYNKSGNVEEARPSSGASTRYFYDPTDRLTKVVVPGSHEISYEYAPVDPRKAEGNSFLRRIRVSEQAERGE